MWVLDHKECWVLKNWCFWTVELEKTLESPLDCKEIKPVILKEINPEYSLEGLMLKLKLQCWPPDVKNWLTGSVPGSRKDWRQEEQGLTEDEMVGIHYQLHGQEFEKAPGVGDGQGSLACCSPWGCKQSDMTERQNCTNIKNVHSHDCKFLSSSF